MNIRVVLADRDKEYIENFKKAVVINYNSDIEYSFFSDEEEFKRHMFEKKCDVLLIDENIEYKEYDGIRLVLTDIKGVNKKNGHERRYGLRRASGQTHSFERGRDPQNAP